MSGVNILNPAVTDTVRGNGLGGWYGWPTSETLERMHDDWLQAPGLAAQKQIATTIQTRCWQKATFILTGQIYQPVAYRSTLAGILPGFVKFYGVRKTA